MAANDVMGKIEFQALDEGTGTDAILVAAAIQQNQRVTLVLLQTQLH